MSKSIYDMSEAELLIAYREANKKFGEALDKMDSAYASGDDKLLDSLYPIMHEYGSQVDRIGDLLGME